ncbi:MAG: DNA alkylation repair protein [Oscillospiraceae bacterium]|nr:DNA alkylation repair protein [Oscillospiraceae bacterium]
MTPDEIRGRLFAFRDEKYAEFQLKLTPGLKEENIIGVRTPALRTLAKEIYKSGDYEAFLSDLPHKYYDEINLHGFIVSGLPDYDEVISRLDALLPYIDNWASCDLISPKKAFGKNRPRLIEDIKRWMSSKEAFTIRFGIEMLMSFFLDDAFSPRYLEWVSVIRSEEYYVNMMKAWFFATALAKQYEATIPFIENHALDDWSHNKAIQKARESYRITPEQKEYLKTLR